MPRSKEKKTYSFFQNAAFLWRLHWAFDRMLLLLMALKTPLTVGAALLGILLPKLVLDHVTRHSDLHVMLLQIAGCALGLLLFKAADAKNDNAMEIHANQFFCLYGFTQIAKKKMDLDYEAYSAPSGKTKAEKASMAVSGNTYSSMVAFYPGLRDVLSNLFGFASFAAIVFTLNPLVILLLLASYAMDGLIALYVEKRQNKLREQEADLRRRTRYIAKRTSLTAFAKDIRIYSLAGWLREIRAELLRKEVALTKQQERPRLLQLLLEGLLVFVRDGLAYGYLISRMLQDPTMELGTFTVYFAAIAGFGNWLSQLVIGADALMRAHHRIGDYRAFLDIPDTTRVPDGVAVASRPGPHTIRLEHVSYTYPESDRLVLDDISLEIGAGENLALVGVNGAGKTTLVKLLCGLIRPTKGEIYVDGINIREIDREEYFKLFAAVFQDICVLPVSIAENISYAVTPQQQDEKRLIAALEAAGLQEKIAALPQGANTPLLTQFNKDGIELSGGELQKLLLARALYKDAPVLILDEPTAALDPIAENRLYLQYHTLTKGKTSVYISHRLSSTRFCDRIVLLDGAKIAESGTHEALLASDGKYAAMFALSSKYYREAEEGDTHEIA